MIKTCLKCKRELDISMFSKNKNTADGLSTQCKDCTKAYRESIKNKPKDIYQEFYGKHKFVDNVEYKFCSSCHNWLTLDNFSSRKDSKDGLRDQCTDCRKLQYNEWASKNIEQNKRSQNKITHKICTCCKQDKNILDFTVCLTNPDGYQYVCKDCKSKYRQENAEHIKETAKAYREKSEVKEYMQKYITDYYSKSENIERRNKNSAIWYANNKDKVKKYYEDNKEYILERNRESSRIYRQSEKYNSPEEIEKRQQYHKQWYQEHYKEKLEKQRLYKIFKSTPEYKEMERQKARKRWYSIPKEERQAKAKLYRQMNIDKIREKDRERHEKNKLNRNMSKALYRALKENKAERHWEDLVPYNLQQIKEHLESQFTPEMSWDNYGTYWEIDHIIPQNLFHIETENDRDFQICWSLANLRPFEKSLNRQRPKDGSDIPDSVKQNILNQLE